MFTELSLSMMEAAGFLATDPPQINQLLVSLTFNPECPRRRSFIFDSSHERFRQRDEYCFITHIGQVIW
ncbi:hypothetical protein [Lihuaxuella thermophila]|uniref:hypothetical protein n=1 Tax=Lihuaxuella thermophila TaxID=1173111 RepID=UPI0011140AD2|nr:hypothetical protein [Lihuaxuella thermophila]